MADIFISYAREDRAAIEPLSLALEAVGLTVWWDRDIDGGAEFSALIEKELEAARTVIVAWSAHSISSHWVRDEADFARGEQKLLPISIDGSLPPLGFRQLHALEFKSWDEKASHSCFQGLLKSLGCKPEPAAPVAAAPATQRATKAGKPGVAVLPLVNMSTDPEIEFLADGMSEDMITMLSTSQHLHVAARTSTFAYKGQTTDIREVGAALGVRYVIEGSIRKLGPRARINIQLIDAETGAHCWAKKFDEALENLTAAPDEMQEQIVGALFTQLFAAEAERAVKAPPESLGAWEYCVRAAIAIGQGAGSLKTWTRIREELKRAVELEPDYALGHALLAWCSNAGAINGLYSDENELSEFVADARKHFARGRDLAGDDILAHTYLGGAENFAGMQERCVHRMEGVLKRNPANSEGWFVISMGYAYLSRFDAAADAIERAAKLAPEGGYAPMHEFYRGQIHYLKGDYAVARAYVESRLRDEPGNGYCAVLVAICAHESGDERAARAAIDKIHEHSPSFTPQKVAALILSQPDKEKAQRELALIEKLWAEKDGGVVPAPSNADGPAIDQEKPSLAVLPFRNMSTDPEIEFLADGLSEDVIGALGAYRCLYVPARAATITYKDQQADSREVGAALRVRYVVEGSVRKLGARARISVQLIEAATGAHLWSGRFDEALETLLTDPDDVSARICASTFAQFITAETDRAHRLSDEERGAWEYCIMCGGLLSRGSATIKDLKIALEAAAKAIDLAPDNAIVHGITSWFCNVAICNGLYDGDDYSDLLAKAKSHLQIARSLAADDPYALVWIGASENYGGMQADAVRTLEGVVKRNPSSAEAYYCLSMAYAYLGRFDEAGDAIDRATELAPEGGLSRHHGWYRGLVYFLAGDYKMALAPIRAQAVAYPDYGYCNVVNAIIHEEFGQHDEALKYIARAKEHNPQLTPDKLTMMLAGQSDREKGAREFAVMKKLWAEEAA